MKPKEEAGVMLLPRRSVVLGIAAGLAALAERGAAIAQPAAQQPFRVDLHHHVIPPKWVDAARAHKPDNTWGPQIVGWTPSISIEQMDKHRIAYAVTELGLPGVWWAPPDQAASLARYCNEYVPICSGSILVASACSQPSRCRMSMRR